MDNSIDIGELARNVSLLSRARKRRQTLIASFMVLGPILALAALYMGSPVTRGPKLAVYAFATFAAVSWAIAGYIWYKNRTVVLQRAVEHLTREWNPSICGALIDVLGTDSTLCVDLAVVSLRVLVPRMTDEHFTALDEVQRKAIRRMAIFGTYDHLQFHLNWPELRIALGRVIALYGDRDDLHSLKTARVLGFTNHDVVWNLIPVLEARLADTSSHEMLLRSSDTPTGTTKELVRPSAGNETPAEHLLRPE